MATWPNSLSWIFFWWLLSDCICLPLSQSNIHTSQLLSMIFFLHMLPSCQKFLLFLLVQVVTNTTMFRASADLVLRVLVCNLSQGEMEAQGLERSSRLSYKYKVILNIQGQPWCLSEIEARLGCIRPLSAPHPSSNKTDSFHFLCEAPLHSPCETANVWETGANSFIASYLAFTLHVMHFVLPVPLMHSFPRACN